MNREWKPHTRHHRRSRKVSLENPPKGLVLARFLGQSLIIGEDITITVVACSSDRVELCIDAPKHVSIDREEIRYRKNNDEKQVQ